MSDLPTGTVTFLFTDIEGSTRLLKHLGERYGALLADHQRLIRDAVLEQGGREIDTQGDSFFFAFARANAALGAAVVAQRALAEHTWPEGARVRVRMGLHTGEPVVGEERYVGMGVHRAARIGAAGHGGQVLLSNATRELVDDKLGGVSVRDLGSYRLKDIDRPERLFQLDVDGLQREFPPLKAEKIAEPHRVSRRTLLVAALAGVLAAAVAIPIFAFGQGGSDGGSLDAAAADSVGIVDSESGRLVADVAVGTTPTNVAAGLGAVWVTSSVAGTVARIDPKTRTVRQTIRVGSGASGIAVGGRAVWVANGLDGTVSRIDPTTNEVVQTIEVGNGPSGVAVGEGSVWVTNRDDHTVVRIDSRTGSIVKTFGAGTGPTAIAVGSDAVWVTSESAGTVLRVNPRTSSIVETINVGRGPVAVAAGPGAVWVANSLDGTVSRIDPRKNVVTATVPVGEAPRSVSVTAGSVWVSSEFGPSVSRIDPTTNAVVQETVVGSRLDGVASSPEGVFVAVGPAGGAHRGGTLRVLAETTMFDGGIDPALTYDVVGWSALTVTNDGLLAFRRVGGPEGTQLAPNLAIALPEPTDAGKTYTFQVRRGIRYSTGAPVRPSDFRRALERVFELRSPGALFYERIVGTASCKPARRCDLSRGVVADERAGTVTFRLAEPDPEFLYKLALPFAFALPASTPTNVGPTTPLPATGPYVIAAYVPGRQLRLVRNARFREWSQAAQPSGYADEIVIARDSPQARRAEAVRRGHADLTGVSVVEEALADLKTLYASRLHVQPTRVTHFFFLNTRVEPFDAARVRRALNYAVDRDELVRIYGGPDAAQPTCQVLPPNFPGFKRYCPYPHDLARAKRLVAASGTKGARVEVWTPAFAKAQSSYFVSVLRELGFRARLRTVDDLGEYYAAIAKPGVQAGGSGWLADYTSAGSFIHSQFSCSVTDFAVNPARFCDREVERATTEAFRVQAGDPAAASALWVRVDRMIVDRAPYVFTVNPRSVDFVSGRVGNYRHNPQWGVLLDQLWVR